MYRDLDADAADVCRRGRLNVLVEFLDEDYEMSQDLVLIGVNGIWNIV